MAILKATDFIDKPYQIPNQEESPEFEAFIARWEAKLLKALLGLDLYNAFINDLAEATPLAIYTDLRDGDEYQWEGETFEWVGMVEMLRPAIYSEWIKQTHRHLTTSGMIGATGQQNTQVLDPMPDIVEKWNEYAMHAGVDYSIENTLYGFMYVNTTDYENDEGELIFNPPQLKNRFDF